MSKSVVPGRVTAFRDEVTKLCRAVSDLAAALKAGDENPARVQAALSRVGKSAETLERAPDLLSQLRGWIQRQKEEIESERQARHRAFGGLLAKELEAHGLPLSGNLPKLESGVLTIVPDFERQRVTIWFGPEQERLAQLGMDPKAVADGIKAVRANLGVGESPEAFLAILNHAIARRRLGDPGRSIRLTALLPEIAILVQPATFRNNPVRDNYRNYGRADLAFDLSRLLLSPSQGSFLTRYRLAVAPRAETRQRQDFLWVPRGDASTGGTAYSHLEVKEGVR